MQTRMLLRVIGIFSTASTTADDFVMAITTGAFYTVNDQELVKR